MSDNGCLIPLPWETRNLGIASFSLSEAFPGDCDETKLRISMEQKAKEHGSFFVQARIKMDTRLAQLLERNGFYFVETTVYVLNILHRNSQLRSFVSDNSLFLPPRYNRSDLVAASLNRDDAALCAAVKRIASESFTEDRFHVDHNCARDVANRRFVYWLEDLLGDAKVVLYVLFHKQEPIAFMARKADHLMLSGFAKKYVSAGLGEYFWLSVLKQMKQEGMKHARGVVSVRNIPSLNLCARTGFKLRDAVATFHYWHRSGTAP